MRKTPPRRRVCFFCLRRRGFYDIILPMNRKNNIDSANKAEKTLKPSSEHTQLAQEETSVIETQQTVTSLADPPQLETPPEKKQNPKLKQLIQILAFTGFSISAGVIQIVSFGALCDWTKLLPWWPAYLISLILSVVWNFTFNRKFTFRAANNIPLAMGLVVVYYCMFTPVSVYGGDAIAARLPENLGMLVTFLMMLVNFVTEFLWDKFLVFNEKVTGKIESLFRRGNQNVIVVGAGISGLTAARVLAEAGYRVTVAEQRDTVGGNVYDYFDENGIIIQKYGPHIFHTNDKTVFEFLSRFTEWIPYEHRVLGYIDDKYVPVPFNLTSLFALYPEPEAEEIKTILTQEIGLDTKVPILQLKQHKEKIIRDFAEFVYKNVFYTYTMKQWGFPPEELGEAVMNRVPVYISYEDRYFTDKYQYQPKDGYTKLAENLLAHKNITLITGKNALDTLKIEDGAMMLDGKPFEGKVIFTGRIDDLFLRKYGALAYRSLDFVFETHSVSSYQPAAVVNYTTSEDFTRISEFTKFCCFPKEKTVIVKEYSKACGENDIPYYPIPKQEYLDEYEKYRAEAEKVKNLYLLGRLACYRYMNMDAAVKSAIELAEKIKKS